MRKPQSILYAPSVPLTPEMLVRRALPSRQLSHVDPFVFLDHFGPATFRPGDRHFADGTGPHPHRGFITFTYLFDGEMEHTDSRGHRGTVGPGGAQWMKAASGILHDEKPSHAFLEKGGTLSGIQLWINLPAAHKNEVPDYRQLPSEEVPESHWPNGAVLRVLIGAHGTARSPIPMYSPMWCAHLKLPAGTSVELELPADWEAFAYVAAGEADFGAPSATARSGALVRFERHSSDRLHVTNPGNSPTDAMLFAGLPIGEPILASGPFVMDTQQGLRAAYDDFYAGKYGQL
jgi:redox-sensitive bicupin YhaK (pirin superfamily)